MQRALIRTADDVKVSIVVLPDTWTGAEGEWQVPDGHHLGTDLSNRMPPPLPAVADVIAECDRRLALGFDYDFGDERGVHRIGTTERDMRGWDEVTSLAQARINASDATPIGIATDTGACLVTPTEWNAILLAAAAFRQPIWAASFALQAMETIPADYADDSHWEGV